MILPFHLEGYLVSKSTEEAPGEVEHVHRPSDLGIHILNANEAADGDNGPVASEAITWKKIKIKHQQLSLTLWAFIWHWPLHLGKKCV